MPVWRPLLFLFHLLLSVVRAWEPAVSFLVPPAWLGRVPGPWWYSQCCQVVYSLPVTHPQQPREGSASAGPRHGEARETTVLKAPWDRSLVNSAPRPHLLQLCRQVAIRVKPVVFTSLLLAVGSTVATRSFQSYFPTGITTNEIDRAVCIFRRESVPVSLCPSQQSWTENYTSKD